MPAKRDNRRRGPQLGLSWPEVQLAALALTRNGGNLSALEATLRLDRRQLLRWRQAVPEVDRLIGLAQLLGRAAERGVEGPEALIDAVGLAFSAALAADPVREHGRFLAALEAAEAAWLKLVQDWTPPDAE